MRNYAFPGHAFGMLCLTLLLSLFFSFSAHTQPGCGGYNPPGDPPLDISGMVVGSSFVATTDCLGQLSSLQVKRSTMGGPIPAQLKIYLGLIGSGEILIYTKSVSLVASTNMIMIDPQPGQDLPCLEQGAIYTFTFEADNPATSISLMGYDGNPYLGGQFYADGYLADNDLFFSFTGTDDGEITVSGNNISITDGDMTPSPVDDTDFGTVAIGGSVTNTFTITNDGNMDLLLTGSPFVTVSGSVAFSVMTQPASGTIPPGGSVTFSITFAPNAQGVFLGTVNILNSDCSEQLFNFQIQGTGAQCEAPDIPTLGASDNNVCPGASVTLSVLSGDLNDAADWHWYDDECGGNLVGTGTSLQVAPTATTTWYVRGEGNCVTPGACAEITVVVEDLEAPVITCPPAFSLEVDDECQAIMPDLTLLQGLILADSEGDFSNVQGQGGWFYGYYPAFDPQGFTQLDPANFSMNTWFGIQSSGSPFLNAGGGHPGVDDGVWAVRRWIGNHTGPITISGEFQDLDLNCGDGSNVRIFQNGTQIYQALSIPGTPTAYALNLFLTQGDQLDFVVDPIFTTGCDNTRFTAQIIVNSGLEVTDNCSISLIFITQSPPAGSPVGPGLLFVQLTATDSGGNSDICTVDVSVEDNTPPTALCQDITVQLNAQGAATITANQINDGSSDNCGILSLELDQTAFACEDVGPNQVTLTVTDENFNTSACTATVTVEDNIFPQALCQNLSVDLDDLGVGAITPQQVDDGSSDNCDVSLSLDISNFTCADVGSVQVTLTATDPGGNSSTCTAQIAVGDPVAPQAQCQDITIELDASGNAVIAPEDVDDGSNDACGIASISLDQTNFDCDMVGDNTVTLTVTDANGNSSTCTATVTVEENGNPQAICQDITVYLDEFGDVSIEPEDVNNGSSDPCGLASLEAAPTEFGCADVGANTVTLTVTDNNGNSSSCEATVTVLDTIPPSAICQDITVQVDANGVASITAGQIDNGSDDACGIALLKLDETQFTCEDLGEVTVTLTVTDANGNSSICSATVTVADTIAPTALCQDQTIELDANGQASLSADDVNDGSFDNCGIASLVPSQTEFDCEDVGVNPIALVVTDLAGNSSVCNALVTVEDNLPPVAVCQDQSVQLDANGLATIQGSQLNGGSTDNCEIDEIKPIQQNFNCNNLGPNMVLVIVTDSGGNSATCTATVTVFDLLPPVAQCQDIVVLLSPAGTLTLTPAAVDGGTTDNCSFTLSLDATQFDCDDVGLQTVTLTATDGSGNSDTCTANVSILASQACPGPPIVNTGGPNVADPCTCLSDGQFAEEIVIGPTLPGLMWQVALNTGLLDAMTLLPFPAGTMFQEIPIDSVQSIYVLPGVHLDGIGYTLEAISPFFPGATLAIANLCYYPDPQIVGLSGQYCLNSNPVPLVGTAGGVDLISEGFTVNGLPATMFNPMSLGVGVHTVTYTVNAGTATPFDPTDPGCIASVTQLVEITPSSPGVMVCNDLVFVSVDENCEALIVPDMVLEGNYYCYDDFEVNIFLFINQIPNPITSQYVGLTLDYTVVNLNNWNTCSGKLIVADLLEPTVVCTADPFVIGCHEDLSLVPPPLATDNCTVSEVLLISETYLDTDACDDGKIQIEQVWIAVDIYDNVSEPCTRIIEIQRTSNDLIDFPNDITWECSQYEQFPGIIDPQALHPTILLAQQGLNPINASVFGLSGFLAQTGSGVPGGIQGTYCGYSFTHSDQIIPLCGTTFQIIRTWTVLDQCTGQVITGNVFGEDNVQIISVLDLTPPQVTVPPFTLSANIPGTIPGSCTSQGLLPPPVATDNCNTWTWRVFTPIGEGIYLPNGWAAVPPPGLGLGTHTITYEVTDACQKTTTLEVQVDVIDDIVPTVVCDQITDVNLSSDGTAVVNAITFDDGSYDNCCVADFLVRRKDGDCNGGYDDFGPTVTFCCEDVANNPITVILRVVDCFDNFNECEVIVFVNDKITPFIASCPPGVSISCEEYNATYMMPLSLGDNSILDNFGTPLFFDNCINTLNVDYTVNVQVDNCGKGSITRTWAAYDDAGNGPAYCTQSILVYHESDWVVEFPADITAVCTNGALPDFGEPKIFFDDCELIAVSYADQVFTVVPDACYKIERAWTVINWCIFDQYGSNVYSEAGKSEANLNVDWDGDGDKDNRTFRDGYNSSGSPGTPDGFITYRQIIKVMDNEAPVFVVPTIDGCILDATCATTLTLPYPTIMDDCSLNFKVDITGSFGSFPNVTGPVNVPNVIAGTYTVTYAVRDNCGNTGYQSVTIVVKDCKKPTVICEALIVEIMQTGMIEIAAELLDSGSSDNCSPISFSFSANTAETTKVFTCADLGPNNVQLWVTDAEGNQDFCITVVTVQDNFNVCGQQIFPTVAGLITNEDDEILQGALVQVNGGAWNQTTGADGLFSFQLPGANDYTVSAHLDENASNGVTTYDMVLIQRHILGVSMLNSPYKVIAADANNSGTVTTLDLVAIRKVILVLADHFPNNTSWRFVPASQGFGDPLNPWADAFSEVFNYNNLSVNQLNADFIAIKVGDVNGTATMNLQQGAESREAQGALAFNLRDRMLERGKTYQVPFFGNDQAVFGYQFTMEISPSIEILGVEEGVTAGFENFGFAKLDQGALTTSWNEAVPRPLLRSERLFSLQIKARERTMLSDALGVSSRFTAAEAYGPQGEMMDIRLAFEGQMAHKDKMELYQNEPNPFDEITKVRFSLPSAGRATLTVTDAAGQLLTTISRHYEAGVHEVQLSELGEASGVLYYRLETEQDSAVRKMIRIK